MSTDKKLGVVLVYSRQIERDEMHITCSHSFRPGLLHDCLQHSLLTSASLPSNCNSASARRKNVEEAGLPALKAFDVPQRRPLACHPTQSSPATTAIVVVQ